ncbi:MAG TPA: zinc-binding dehydrogenase, partial [Planctomycetota bacterium]|nr:zinc-binding dehydrogenase [Planctomycetota bacterium]
VLADGGEVGFEHPGGYAEHLVTEAKNVRVLPDGFPPATAALIEPLAVGVRALRRLDVKDKRSALVLGDGPIGLIVLMLLKHHGVKDLCLVGGRPTRLALARELVGARTLNYHDVGTDLAAEIRRAFDTAFANVIEASGSAAAMQAALDAADHRGKVLVLGDYRDARADFPWNTVLLRELEIVGSNASADAWDEAVALAVDGEIPLERLVSHRIAAREFARGIEIARTSRDVVKIILEW